MAFDQAHADALSDLAAAEADRDQWKAKYEEQLAGTRSVDDMRMREIGQMQRTNAQLAEVLSWVAGYATGAMSVASDSKSYEVLEHIANAARNATREQP